MTIDEIRKLIDTAPNDGDEMDWLDAWLKVGPKLLAVADVATRVLDGHLGMQALEDALAALEAET